MKIKLLKLHTHGGKVIPAGTLLDAETPSLPSQAANWLVAVGTAVWAPDEAEKPTEPPTSGGESITFEGEL